VQLELFDPSVLQDHAEGAWAAAPPHDPVRRLALSPASGGWWEATVAGAGPGTPYLFAVDDQRGRPDPRSAWQPCGVHGPSVVIDHDAFGWHDAGWSAVPLADALVYEAHVGTLTPEGTFAAAIGVLDELVDLGVTHLELMPVATFGGRWGWGYDGVDLYAPHPAYGTPDDLKALVDAAHQRGLAVLVDCVYNHLGPEGAYLDGFGPYFTDTYSTPWGAAVNVDGAGSDEVRRFIVDNALMWLRDYHADGLRLDAVHAIIDTSAVHILEQLSAAVDDLADQLGRELVLIAESDRNDPRLLEDRAIGGYGIDAHWDDDFHHALHVALTGEQDSYYVDYGGLEPLRQALRHAYVYRGQFSEHRERHHGRPPVGLLGDDFVAYVQNHDQIGNRARGERASHLVSTPRLKVAAAVVATSPFVPMLFQGEEWAASAPFPYFADHRDDPTLAEAVRSGRLDEFASFGWTADEVLDPEDPETFYLAILDRAEHHREPHRSLRRWYRDLYALRRAEPALRDGRYEDIPVEVDDEAGTLVVRRGPILVALDLGPEPVTVDVPPAGEGHTEPWELLLASERGIRLEGDRLWLPSDSVAILGGPGTRRDLDDGARQSAEAANDRSWTSDS
jgi:maltooligosyltrehalose trehalohydrolase